LIKHHFLNVIIGYLGSKVPDWRLVNTHVNKEGKLSKEDFVTIIKEATDIMSKVVW